MLKISVKVMLKVEGQKTNFAHRMLKAAFNYYSIQNVYIYLSLRQISRINIIVNSYDSKYFIKL